MSKELELYIGSLATTFPAIEKDGHTYELRGDRIVRDGKETAVLISRGFGSGFISDNYGDVSPMEPKIVIALLIGRRDLLTEENIYRALGIDRSDYDAPYITTGGVRDLTITWVPIGKRFKVMGYDGAEYVLTEDALVYTA